tara:strand:- start:1072 stop:2538 length:1467 start_codon:yes stop_codon:yes gene_type:complete
MSEVTRVLPSTIDYSNVLPESVPAIARRHKFYAANGTDFNFIGTRTIRIELPSASALLDPTHTYIGFEATNASILGQTLGLDIGGAHCFFDAIRVTQGGRVLSECREAHRLQCAVIAPSQLSSDGQASEGIKGSTRSYNTVGAASNAQMGIGSTADLYGVGTHHNADTYWANGFSHRFTMNITSGLFGQNKLIPLNLVRTDAPITIELDMATAADVGCWSAAPGAGDIRIAEIAVVAQLIEVGQDVMNQFRAVQESLGGQLVISGQDWEYSSDTLPANAPGTFMARMPTRKRSLKSLFWICQSNDFANAAIANNTLCYNLSYSGQPNIDSWNLKVGSVVHPSEPIRGFGNTAAAGASLQRGESLMELAKAWGTLGWSHPTGCISGLMYGATIIAAGRVSNGANGFGAADAVPTSDTTVCACPNGLSLEAFAREARESGVDTETLSQDTYLQLNFNAATAGAEVKQLHMWVLYDQHYYFNSNGDISYSN